MGHSADRGWPNFNPATDYLRDGADDINAMLDAIADAVPFHGAEAGLSLTSASGVKTITHGLGFTPSHVIAQSMVTAGITALVVYGTDTYTATQFNVRFGNVGSAITVATNAQCRWIAFR